MRIHERQWIHECHAINHLPLDLMPLNHSTTCHLNLTTCSLSRSPFNRIVGLDLGGLSVRVDHLGVDRNALAGVGELRADD